MSIELVMPSNHSSSKVLPNRVVVNGLQSTVTNEGQAQDHHSALNEGARLGEAELRNRPLNSKDVKPVNPKGNQPWIFFGRIDAEAPILWPPDVKSQLIRKDFDVGKDWKQEEKGMIEDEIVGWHYQLNGHEFEQALGHGEGQGSLAC